MQQMLDTRGKKEQKKAAGKTEAILVVVDSSD